jgi:hypothetical protein
VSAAFILFLLRKHFITEFFKKKQSGDVNYAANFPFFFCFIRTLNPHPPLVLALIPSANSKPILSP